MSAAKQAIRVVIVEDSPTMRAILKTRLEREGDIVVIGAAANAAEVAVDAELRVIALRPMPRKGAR